MWRGQKAKIAIKYNMATGYNIQSDGDDQSTKKRMSVYELFFMSESEMPWETKRIHKKSFNFLDAQSQIQN